MDSWFRIRSDIERIQEKKPDPDPALIKVLHLFYDDFQLEIVSFFIFERVPRHNFESFFLINNTLLNQGPGSRKKTSDPKSWMERTVVEFWNGP